MNPGVKSDSDHLALVATEERVASVGRSGDDTAVGADRPTTPSSDRSIRLDRLADRLDRTLAHRLVALAELAWHGPDATAAIDRLRARLIELRIASTGLRTTAAHIASTDEAP